MYKPCLVVHGKALLKLSVWFQEALFNGLVRKPFSKNTTAPSKSADIQNANYWEKVIRLAATCNPFFPHETPSKQPRHTKTPWRHDRDLAKTNTPVTQRQRHNRNNCSTTEAPQRHHQEVKQTLPHRYSSGVPRTSERAWSWGLLVPSSYVPNSTWTCLLNSSFKALPKC